MFRWSTPRLLFVVPMVLVLPGCVFTGSDYKAASTASSEPSSGETPAASMKNSGEIVIREDAMPDCRYRVLGDVDAYGRAINLLSSDPTREDVNEALRVEAAKLGADAVINVTYRTERTGLASRGKMVAHGQVVKLLK